MMVPKRKKSAKTITPGVERIYMELGDRIRMHRKRAGYTQQFLADGVGITRAALANIELGRQRIMLHYLTDYALHLGIKPQELVRGLWS